MHDPRPEGVSDDAWFGVGVVGAVYTRCVYPSFIELPDNSAFLTCVSQRPVYMRFIRAGRALNLTDYTNDMIVTQKGNLKIPNLRASIGNIDPNNISAEIADVYGSRGIGLTVEKTGDRIWRNVPFSEIVVGWEVTNSEAFGVLSPSRSAIRALLQAFRFARNDLRARLEPAVTGALPLVRSATVKYRPVGHGNAFDRLVQHEPTSFRLDVVSFEEAIDGIASTVKPAEETEDLSERVGRHLLNFRGFPELFVELEILAERTLRTKHYRSAFAEVMTLAELTIAASATRLRVDQMVGKVYREGKERHWSYLVGTMLPPILSCYDGERGPLIKKTKELVEIRHRVIHEGYKPTADEVSHALSHTYNLMVILLLPSSYRANYRLRDGLPEPSWDGSEDEQTAR